MDLYILWLIYYFTKRLSIFSVLQNSEKILQKKKTLIIQMFMFQAYTFPCQRSLGRSSDDGSLERLLVANRNYQVASCDDVTIPQIHETIGRYDVIMNQLACISRCVDCFFFIKLFNILFRYISSFYFYNRLNCSKLNCFFFIK